MCAQTGKRQARAQPALSVTATTSANFRKSQQNETTFGIPTSGLVSYARQPAGAFR